MLAAAFLGLALAASPPIAGDWTLTYVDRFNGTSLSADWHTRVESQPPDMTQARADASAVEVRDGAAHLRVLPDSGGGYLNGHIGTEDAFTFTYGYAEARIKFHRFRGSHGAFWLLTPAVYIPEIDVAEYNGARRPWRGNGNLWHNYYWGDIAAPNGDQRRTLADGEAWSRRPHDYGVLWEPTGMTFYIDDVAVHHIATADPLPKFLVLSLLTKDFEIDALRTDRLGSYDMEVRRVLVWQRNVA